MGLKNRWVLVALLLAFVAASCDKPKASMVDRRVQNKKVVKTWVEQLNVENMDYLDQVIHPQFVDHNPFPGVLPNKEGYIGLLKKAHAEWFPHIQVTIEDMVAEGDKVAVRLSVVAKHTGTVMGAPPTGKTLKWDAYAIYRVKDGMLIERWEMLDSFSFMSQLGLAKMANQP